MMEQAASGKPIRQLWPKSRKRGLSTLANAWGWFLAANNDDFNSLTVAHQRESTEEIFSIAKRIHAHSGHDGKTAKSREIVFPDRRSKYRCQTAMGHYGASGSDTHALHVSEAALLENSSNQDAEKLVAMVNSMPEASNMTSLILESTGDGPKGVFPEYCRAAAKGGGAYALVFLPWLEDPDLVDGEWVGALEDFEPPLTQYELRLHKDLGATGPQLSWRRQKIERDHPGWKIEDGNPPLFGYHFPAFLEECFASHAGAIYPGFARDKHVRTLAVEEVEKRDLYRAIDWGWQGKHRFSCLWVAHDPSHPPRLTVDPSCENLIDELVAYHIDETTGKPKKEFDDSVDALRYIVVTMKLRGHVHVYREMALEGAAHLGPTGVCRRIHEMSGAKLPEGASEKDLDAYAGGESFACSVADRSQRGMITQFSSWGIPTIEHGKPEERDNSQGEVWDGIMEVSALIAGDAEFYKRGGVGWRTVAAEAHDKLHARRGIMLTEDEEDSIRRLYHGDAEDGDNSPAHSYTGYDVA